MKIRLLLFTCLIFLSESVFAQHQNWVNMIADSTKSFYEIKAAFDAQWDGKEVTRGSGWKQFQRWAWFMEPRVFPHGNRIPVQQAYHERKKFMDTYGQPPNRVSGWSPLGPSDWTTVSSGYNPGIGRINVVAEHPTDNSILYGGAPSGGLWKSTDAGATWTPLTDHFSAIGVSGIAIDYTNPDVIYISTGDMDGFDTYSIGVMKSEDGGLTWNPTGLVHTLSQFIVCRKIVMHPFNPAILLVATSQGLYKTSNGGDTWALVANGSFRDIEFRPDLPTTIYASTNRVFRSLDGGDSFTQIAVGLPSPSTVNRIELAVSPDEPDWLYVLAGKNTDDSFLGLWRSTDAGQTFQLRADSPNLFGYSETGNDNAGQSWFDMALDVSPTNANTVLVGGVNVWRSTNGGSTFNIVSHWIYPSFTGYTHADIHTLHYFGNRLYCGSDGGLFISTNHGTTWSDLTPGMEITQFYRLGLSQQDANTIIGGAQDNGSNLLKNEIWTHVLGADGMEAAISPTNPNVMFCTMQFGALHRSTDGGMGWNSIFGGNSENGGWVTPFLSLPGNVVLAGYENVWRSTNNGTSFTQISNFTSGVSIRDIAVCKTNTDYIYVAFQGSIHRTTDGGGTWQNISSNLPTAAITDIQVHPQFPDIVWISISGYNNGNKVFVTTNGGGSWENISANLPNLPCNAIVYQEGTNGGLYVGMDVGIYYTDSTLSNWQAFDQDLPNVIINELEIHYGSGFIRAATYGRGIWESELYSPSTLPPTADFGQIGNYLCPGDSVAFFDASLNASPGWVWYFDGGSPATSTLANPTVSFPSSGIYDVALVVSNPNGSDSIVKQVNVNFSENELTFFLTTDNYPEETSWVIEDANGNTIAEGGGYGQSNTSFQQEICVPFGCYQFTIYDAYGDGICCDWGQGGYSLLNASGDVLIFGGQFGFSETQAFCIEDENVSLTTQANEGFLMYPNPASNQLLIDWKNAEEVQLQIADMSGKILIHQPTFFGGSIDVSSLSAGIYIVQLINEKHRLERKLTIIR